MDNNVPAHQARLPGPLPSSFEISVSLARPGLRRDSGKVTWTRISARQAGRRDEGSPWGLESGLLPGAPDTVMIRIDGTSRLRTSLWDTPRHRSQLKREPAGEAYLAGFISSATPELKTARGLRPQICIHRYSVLCCR